MNKNILGVSIIVTGVLFASTMTSLVIAQTKGLVSEISYPIAELGNCTDKTACKTYCDKSENMDACLSFAQKNNLMSEEEIKVAKNFKKTGMTGPGGCKGKNECNTYCSGPDNMDECITFAEKNGMMSGSQLKEAKKVQGAISRGIKPPACGGKDACNTYCSSSEHMAECVSFAEAAGMISKEEADKIKSGGPGGKSGDRPGPDGGKQGPGEKGKGQGGNGGGGKNNRGPEGQGDGQQGRGGSGSGKNNGGGKNPSGGNGGNGGGGGNNGGGGRP